MPADRAIQRGLVDTNIVILRQSIDPAALPDEVAISAITLAELSVGPHAVLGDDEAARLERLTRTMILQRTEHEFDPLPFDAAAARIFGQLVGSVLAVGRAVRRRHADLQIAATAAAHRLPLYTTNPRDYVGTEAWVQVIAVPRPTTTAPEAPPG